MEGAPLSPKYQVATAPGGVVAGRPTTDVVVREYGALVERMAVDLSTGLVLRRELFDDAGRRVRLVEVERLVLGQSTTVPSTPAHKTRRESTRRLKAEAVSAPFDAPTRLDGDYLQVGAFRRGDVVHVLYSDGLHALSVFAQAGKLSTGALPAGGNRTLIGKGKGWRYAWPGGDVLTWQAGGVVFTAVGDAPVADVLAAAASMPWGRRPGLTDRIRRTCRALVETVTGG
jgi:sigma-E factor negative regulatory protein RseB